MNIKKSTAALCLSLPLYLLMACSQPSQESTDAAPNQSASESSAVLDHNPAATGFDLATIPVSTAVLEDFPYIDLPDGYDYQNTVERNFDRVPFWTGQTIEWIEGKVFSSGITAKSDYKQGSFLELQRNITHVIQQLGGVEVTNSKIPKELIEEIPKDILVQHNAGLGDIYNDAAQTYVIRQADKNIWFHLAKSGNYMGLMVAETQSLTITAKALSSNELKNSIDQNSKVSVQINFATDKADILPDSQAQLDQIIALLKDHPDLKLGIYGHTDNTGDAAHNLKLSEQRAASVVTALSQSGIEATRLNSKGFGDTQPVADNTTEAGKAQNRRVELVKL